MARFLLVDDEPALLRTYQRVLLEAGHAILTAAGLIAARSVLAQTAEAGLALDGVLLDLQLGDGDGAELLPLLHELHPRAEVAVVSGRADAMRVITLASRCAVVVPKPLGRDALLALAEELGRRRALSPTLQDLAERARLSPRETEVILQSLAGLENRQIAEQFGCTLGSLKTYWARIFRKTGCRSRREVLALLERRPANETGEG